MNRQKLLINDKYIAVSCYKNKITRDLIQFNQEPIACVNANNINQINCTCLEHVLKYYENREINIIDTNDYICTDGIENTIIKLNNNIKK